MSRLYPDSKTFVDKKLKHPVGKIIRNFESLVKEQLDKNGELLTVEQIKQVRRKWNINPKNLSFSPLFIIQINIDKEWKEKTFVFLTHKKNQTVVRFNFEQTKELSFSKCYWYSTLYTLPHQWPCPMSIICIFPISPSIYFLDILLDAKNDILSTPSINIVPFWIPSSFIFSPSLPINRVLECSIKNRNLSVFKKYDRMKFSFGDV